MKGKEGLMWYGVVLGGPDSQKIGVQSAASFWIANSSNCCTGFRLKRRRRRKMAAGLQFSAARISFFQFQTTPRDCIRSAETHMRIQTIQSQLPYSTTPLPVFSVKKSNSISDSPLFSLTCVSSSSSSSSPSPSPRRFSPSTRLYLSGWFSFSQSCVLHFI